MLHLQAAVFYFFSLLVIGNFILANLFVAILLDGFAERAEAEEAAIREAASGANQNQAVIRLKGVLQGMLSENRVYIFARWKDVVFAASRPMFVEDMYQTHISTDFKVVSRHQNKLDRAFSSASTAGSGN